DPATIGGATSGSGTEDGGAITGTLTATDAADGLTDGTIFSVTSAAGHGTATINAATGAWSYTQVADYNGTDSFTVTVNDDDGNTATQVINITVSAVADITNDTLTTNEDTAISANVISGTGGATADSFESGGRVLTAVTQGTHGTVSFTAAGVVTYTPASNWHGTDSFTYTVTSGGVTETATVNVTVSQVDDPVTIGGATSGTGNEDAGAITGTLTATDAADGLTDGTIFSVTGAAGHGTATIDAATGAWSYTQVKDYNGADSFTVTVTDDDGNTATQVISITVSAVADIVGDSLTTNEDTAISANVITGTNGASADSFENAGKTLTAVTQGAHGTVTFTAAGLVTYTPASNWHGSDSFSYTVTSGGVTETATVNVTVAQVDDPATIGGATSGSGAEDGGAITGTLTATDAADGLTDGTIFSVTSAAGHGTATINAATGAWSYTPVADYNGADSFTVTVTDDDGNTATQVISITVSAVADSVGDSLTTNEDTAISANVITGTNGASADSFENAGKTLTAVTQGAHGTVTFTAAGLVTYTPASNWHGSDSFSYTVTSGGVTETATVNVTVAQVDDPATIGGATSGSGAEDGGAITGTLTATDAADGLTDGTIFSV